MRVEHLSDDVTLILGDCREVLPTLGRFDALITDPPYGIAKVWKGGFSAKHGWAKAKDESGLRNDWDESVPSAETLLSCIALCKEAVIWGGNYFDLPPSRCWLVWNKPERNFTLAEAELAWTNRDAVVRVHDAPRSEPNRVHPTQKPISVMRFSIAAIPNCASVLDPFMGSGTTGVAAVQSGKSFCGIEREATYFDIAVRRISDALARPDMFVQRAPEPKQEALL